MLEKEISQSLVKKAMEARGFAYAPYSGFSVGAALLCKDGEIYTGCNVENAAFTPGNCAERTAFFKAVSEGKRDFTAIAIVGGSQGKKPKEFCAPCGVCRQVMREFCKDDFYVILAKEEGMTKEFCLKELLPESFGPNNIG